LCGGVTAIEIDETRPFEAKGSLSAVNGSDNKAQNKVYVSRLGFLT
jgi:hypothetical protein